MNRKTLPRLPLSYLIPHTSYLITANMMNHPSLSLLIGLLGTTFAIAQNSPAAPSSRPADAAPLVATFSVVGFDPATGDLGVAVQSKFFGVGTVVPWAKAGVGAIATQSRANVNYGPDGLAL